MSVKLTVNMRGQVYAETFNNVGDADLAVRAAAKRHGFAVQPHCTDTGEDLGRGKVIRVSTGTTFGGYTIV